MPSKITRSISPDPSALHALGQALRLRRKVMGINAVTAAQAAGMSRVTLHRIEKGESSVTMGAWLNLASALGMQVALQVRSASPTAVSGLIPTQIRLADYPQLQALAWQVHADHLSPLEAYDVYERNQKHMNLVAMTAQEQQLWQALQTLAADVYRFKPTHTQSGGSHVQ